MWETKFDFDGNQIFFGNAAKKFDVTLTGYPLSNYERNNKIFVNLVGTVQGAKENKQKFLNFIKKSKYLIKYENNNDFLNILIKEEAKFKPFYSPYFIYLSPVIIDNNGVYHYHLGSWQREELNKLLKFAEKVKGYQIQTLKQRKINHISILGIQPNLTEKQRKAYELAVKEGYYEHPKKTELKKLAKMCGIAYSTFQQHLSYAEKKIGEFFIGTYRHKTV